MLKVLKVTNSLIYFVLILKCLPRFVITITQILICPPVYILWFIIFQPVRFFNKDLFWWLEGLAYDAYLTVVSSWMDHAGHTIHECGDDIAKFGNDEALVLVNHQHPNDIGTIMRVFQGKNMIFSRIVWIMDWLFQFLNFGWVSKAHGDFFLLQAADAKRLSKLYSFDIEESKQNQFCYLKQNLKSNFHVKGRKWVILFPEGGFLRKRRSGSQRYAEKNGLPVLENVALPRSGAVETIVNTLGVCTLKETQISNENAPESTSLGIENVSKTPLKWIIDVTIGYHHPMSILEFMTGYSGPRRVTVLYRCFPAHELLGTNPHSLAEERSTSIKRWMYDLYVQKENLLSYFYKFGNFPSKSQTHERFQFLRLSALNNKVLIGIQVAVLITLSLCYAFLCKLF